jgi:long-chain acyl-CoA synthetase
MDIDIELYRREVRLPGEPLVRLSAIDIAPDRPLRTLVFVHGFGGNARQWRHQLAHFCSDSRVIALDLRGHGLSDRPRGDYSMPRLVDDVCGALDVLGVQDRAILAGHSFGGAIATEFAAAHAERLERLVLIAAAGEYRLAPSHRAALGLPLAVLNLAYAAWARRFISAAPHAMKAMYLQALRPWNGWDLFGRISVPTLVIRGTRDRVLDPKVFEEVARRIPDAEDVDMGASAHMVMLERSQAVNRAIERFMRGPEARRGGRATTAAPAAEPAAQVSPGLRRERPWLDQYDPGVPATIGVPPVPMHRLLRSAARRHPLRAAIRFEGSTLTYRRLNRESSRFANLLRGLGVQAGDKVLLLLPNLPQTVIAYYGVLKTGAVLVFTTPLSEPVELARQVRDSGARVLVTLTRLLATARSVRAETALEHIILANVKDYLPEPKRAVFAARREAREGHRPPRTLEAGEHLWSAELYKHGPHAPDVEVQPDDLAVLQYTSGTTARPRGVMLSHHNLVANALQTRHWLPGFRDGHEVFLSVLPFSHAYGMTAAMNVPVALAATMIILPSFVTHDVLRAIRRYRPSIFPGVPTMFMAINNFPAVRRFDIQSVKACISGAAPLPVEVQEAFEKLTRGRLVEGYGLTEATTVTHGNPLAGRRKVGSIGVPLPSTEARIIDLASGKPLPPGQIGELAVRGPQVMLGYWNAPDETRQVLSRDGWLLTGDVARMDEDGFFEVVARKRDMILAGDYQVYPRDVEEVLYENPKVKEVAVVGVQPQRWPFQRVKAYVVLREGASASEAELRAFCERRLAEYAVPWKIEFRKELPKNFVGKVLRRLLVEEAEQGRSG